MRRVFHPLLVCAYLVVAGLPVFAMLAEIEPRPLEGAFPPAPSPTLTLAGVRSEQYQTQLVQWFEGSLGLRALSVRLDNTLLYHVFGETKFDSHVRIGSDDFLFERDDITYYNRSGAQLPAARDFDKLADDIARLQAVLRARGKSLVPLFVPSKTTFYPDKVPPLWTRDIGQPRPSTERLYLTMKRALDARGVVYVDGIELLLGSAAPRDLLWGRQARHFSAYAGCLLVHAALARHAELTRTPPLDYPCVPELGRAHRAHPDVDLFRLLNAWRADRDWTGRNVDHTPVPNRPAPHAPRTMWIATSFGWVMTDEGARSGRLPETHLAYYNGTLFDMGRGYSYPIKAFDDTWNAAFPTRDLYVLELFETYLAPSNYFIADAVGALLTAFEPAPGARSAPPR